jgi:hypothetical protein
VRVCAVVVYRSVRVHSRDRLIIAGSEIMNR